MDFNKMTANEKYQLRKQEINDKIQRLQQAVDTHMKPDEKIDWACVGDLGHVDELLDELLEFVNG